MYSMLKGPGSRHYGITAVGVGQVDLANITKIKGEWQGKSGDDAI